jgi:hypothetical protein
MKPVEDSRSLARTSPPVLVRNQANHSLLVLAEASDSCFQAKSCIGWSRGANVDHFADRIGAVQC